MKKIFLLSVLTILIIEANAQSDSYLTMKDTFKGGKDVFHFGVSGFLCRAVLTMSDEHEFRNAISDVKNVRFIIVPKSQFAARNLSLDGFKKVLKNDSFSELANFRDHGDYVYFFVQEKKKNKDRYFILVDEGQNIVSIEMKGYVDMNKLMSLKNELALNDH